MIFCYLFIFIIYCFFILLFIFFYLFIFFFFFLFSFLLYFFFFFFQAEDGIRDLTVTGVQTCALPIFRKLFRGAAVLLRWLVRRVRADSPLSKRRPRLEKASEARPFCPNSGYCKIGRASCRERV